jgi:hypothetical protein
VTSLSVRSARIGQERPFNVRANRTAEADDGWPRKDNFYQSLERPAIGCHSGSGR